MSTVTDKQNGAVLRAAMITAFITTFMGSSLNMSIPAIETEFQVSGALVGWVVTSYTIAVAALSVPFGRISDITGRRRIFLTGVVCFGAASLVCMFSPDILVMMILRVLQGAAAAMIFATNNAILISVYPASQRGRVLGLSTAGRRRIFLTGVVCFGAASLVCMFSPDILVMMILRVLQGAAAAMIFATNNAILISVYPASQRGRVLGLSTAATYVGLSAGPVAGGFLNHYVGWRSIFAAAFLVSAAAFLASRRHIPNDRQAEDSISFDISGNILYICAIGMSLYGLSNLSEGIWAWAAFAAGIGAGAGFFLYEKGRKQPLIRVEMFREDIAFSFSNLAALLNYGATFAISYLMSIYLQVVMGFTSQDAGLILICMPLIQAVFSPVMGKLSDKVRPHKIATAGMMICVAALAMFSFIDEDTGLWFAVSALMTAGFGFAVFSAPNTNAIMERVREEDYGIANSIVATMRTYGQSASMGIVSVVMGMILGDLPMEEAQIPDLILTVRTSFYVFIVLCVMAVFLSAFRGKCGGGMREDV